MRVDSHGVMLSPWHSLCPQCGNATARELLERGIDKGLCPQCQNHNRKDARMKLKALGSIAAMLLLFFYSAIAGAETATIAWNANAEADLRGYKLYRSFGGSACPATIPATPLVTLGKVTMYSDTLVPAGTLFVCYWLSAIDTADNESTKTAPVSKTFAAPVPPTVTLNIIGAPATAPWTVRLETTLAEPFSTEWYQNGVLYRTEQSLPRCIWGEVAGTQNCMGELKPPGTYVIEARLIKNALEVARKSVTITVPALPNLPPVTPSGLRVTKAEPDQVIIVASLADRTRVITSTKGSTAAQQMRTVSCVK
jgi:hypothetical protein